MAATRQIIGIQDKKLAVDAVTCEPVSAVNSLLNREKQGILAISAQFKNPHVP